MIINFEIGSTYLIQSKYTDDVYRVLDRKGSRMRVENATKGYRLFFVVRNKKVGCNDVEFAYDVCAQPTKKCPNPIHLRADIKTTA